MEAQGCDFGSMFSKIGSWVKSIPKIYFFYAIIPQPPMTKLPSLYGLRACSIVFVILYHLFRFTYPIDDDILLRIPFLSGRFGVNVFFVISGFLITYLLMKEEEKRGAVSLKDFYIRRVLRIFPAYYFLLLVYFILMEMGYIYISHDAWLTALTYTKYLNYLHDYYTSHAWSLSIEENFYLFWPVIFLLGSKRVKGYAVLFIIAIVPFIRVFAYFHPLSWLDEQSIFIRRDAIAMGCFIALHRERLLQVLGKHWNDVFLFSVVALLTWSWISAFAEGTPVFLLFVFLGPLSGTVANICIALILLYSVYGPQGWWYKMLNTRAFNYIGLLSYSLYLWQQLFIYKRDWWVTHFPQNLLCIFGAALFSYYLIERPFLRLKKRFSGKATPQPSPELRMQSV